MSDAKVSAVEVLNFDAGDYGLARENQKLGKCSFLLPGPGLGWTLLEGEPWCCWSKTDEESRKFDSVVGGFLKCAWCGLQICVFLSWVWETWGHNFFVVFGFGGVVFVKVELILKKFCTRMIHPIKHKFILNFGSLNTCKRTMKKNTKFNVICSISLKLFSRKGASACANIQSIYKISIFAYLPPSSEISQPSWAPSSFPPSFTGNTNSQLSTIIHLHLLQSVGRGSLAAAAAAYINLPSLHTTQLGMTHTYTDITHFGVFA